MGFNEQLQVVNDKINNFFNFVGSKLKNFPNLTLGEQISYCCVGLGLVLVITSIILFVI